MTYGTLEEEGARGWSPGSETGVLPGWLLGAWLTPSRPIKLQCDLPSPTGRGQTPAGP